MDCPWNSPGQNTGVSSLSCLQGIFPTQGSNSGLPHCRWILYQLSHNGTPRTLEWVAYPVSRGSSQPRNQTRVFWIEGGFFTNWAIRENTKNEIINFCCFIWSSAFDVVSVSDFGHSTSLVAQRLKHLPATWETWVRSLGWEDPLEKEMATHSSTLAWKIPWMEERGRLQSTGLQRVGHDWAT